MRHEEIRSRWNALSLCHHWFGGADKAARCWTVALTQVSAPLAAPHQPPKRLWEHSLWPHLQLMRLFSRIRQDFPLSEDIKIKSLAWNASLFHKNKARFLTTENFCYSFPFAFLPQRRQSDPTRPLRWVGGEKSSFGKVNSTWLL